MVMGVSVIMKYYIYLTVGHTEKISSSVASNQQRAYYKWIILIYNGLRILSNVD